MNNAEQALVEAMHYPPKGTRGVGTGPERGARWNAVEPYVKQIAQALCLIVQTESAESLNNIEEICPVPGVDAAFIGPSDLATALSHPGNTSHPEVKTTMHDALRRIRATGKAADIFCSKTDEIPSFCNSRTSFVALGADTAILRSAVSLQFISHVSRPE